MKYLCKILKNKNILKRLSCKTETTHADVTRSPKRVINKVKIFHNPFEQNNLSIDFAISKLSTFPIFFFYRSIIIFGSCGVNPSLIPRI